MVGCLLGSYGRSDEKEILTDSQGGRRSMVGRYKVLSELGKGSMGLVYKAQDPKINRFVAIKTIKFSDEFDEDVIEDIKERFFMERSLYFILFLLLFPVVKTKSYNDPLFLVFLVFMFFANFADSNFESHMGSSFFVFFYCFFMI